MSAKAMRPATAAIHPGRRSERSSSVTVSVEGAELWAPVGAVVSRASPVGESTIATREKPPLASSSWRRWTAPR